MADFTPITTQEQFNAAIADRIRREQETISKKYAGFDDLQSKVAEYEKKIGDMEQAAKDSAAKYGGFDSKLAELEGKVKGYETNSVKMRIAHEAGIPYELAGRLAGESEDDIRKDAQELSKLITKSAPAAPLRSSEPGVGDTKTAALRALTNQLTNKGE